MENNKNVTVTITECSEFHPLGESHENIMTVDEAIQIWKRISADRMHGIKAIGIRVEDKDNPNEYSEMDIVAGRRINLEMLQYYPDITENQKAIEFVKELQRKMPDLEVMGEMPENKEESQEQENRPRRHR